MQWWIDINLGWKELNKQNHNRFKSIMQNCVLKVWIVICECVSIEIICNCVYVIIIALNTAGKIWWMGLVLANENKRLNVNKLNGIQ